jgi:hypothetical protein
VILEVISPDGKVVDRIPLRLDVLKDLNALYRRLPDGKYRLLLRRDGREIPIFREVLVLRGGRIFDSNRPEETQDKPPGGKAPEKTTPAADGTSQLSPAEIERLWQRLLVEQALAAARENRAGGVPSPSVETVSGTPAERTDEAAAATVEPPALGAGAVDNRPADSESEHSGFKADDRLAVSGQPLAGAAVLVGLAAGKSRADQPSAVAGGVAPKDASRLATRLWRKISKWLRKA